MSESQTMTGNILDDLDRRLMYEMDLNSRQPLSKFSKRLHISVQRLDYRLRSLERRGVILGYPTVVDLCKLGTHHYFICCIRTYRMSGREQDERLRFIAKDDDCTLAYRCEGAWDAIVGTVAKDVFAAKVTFSRLLGPMAQRIRAKIIYTDMRIYNYGRRYMLEAGTGQREAGAADIFNERKRQYKVTGGPSEAVPHSELDLSILRILSADARTPSVKIAKSTGASPETVVHHIRRMERDGIIEGYTTLLDPCKYGYQFNRITVELASIDETRLHEITEYMKRFPNMFRLIELFEIDGFMMDIVSNTYDEMEHVLSEFRDRYREYIDGMDLNRITKIYKATYFPTFAKTAQQGRKRAGRQKGMLA